MTALIAFSTCSLLWHSAILLLTSLSNNTPKISLHYFWSSKLSTPPMLQHEMHLWNTDYTLPFSVSSHVFKKEGVKKDYRDRSYSHRLSLKTAHFVAFLHTMWSFKQQSFEQHSLGNHSIACNTSLTGN